MKSFSSSKQYGVFILAAIIAAGTFLVGNNQAVAQQNVIKWKCQASLPITSPSWKGNILRVAELIGERTNGRLSITAYPAGSVLPNTEIFPALKRGMIEMGYVDPAGWKSDIPIRQVASLPYAFQNVWEVMYFFKTMGFSKMFADQIAKHGVLYWDNRVISADLVTKRPVNSVNDLKGMKIRGNSVTANFFSLAGAQPVNVPGPEIYTGMATGVFEGAHWGPAYGAESLGLYEVAKYHMVPSLYMGTEEGFFINKNAFDKLPKDIQDIVKNILDAEFYPRSVDTAYLAEESLNRMKNKYSVKVIELPKKDQQILFQSAQKIWDEVASANDENAKAVQMLKTFLRNIGRVE